MLLPQPNTHKQSRYLEAQRQTLATPAMSGDDASLPHWPLSPLRQPLKTVPRQLHIATSIFVVIGIILYALETPGLYATRPGITRRSSSLDSRTASSIRIAYIILVDETNHAGLPSLLRALCEPDHGGEYAVLFDAAMSGPDIRTSSELAISALDAAGCNPNDLRVIPREQLTYPGNTLTRNVLSAAAHLLRADVKFDYLTNISPSDYPTARPQLIRSLLSEQSVARYRLSFATYSEQESWSPFQRKRFNSTHIDQTVPGGNASSPYTDANTTSFHIAKSLSWFIWSRELVEHIVLDPRARRMLSLFSLSDIADEHYFATVVWNNPYFRVRTVPCNFRNIFFASPNGLSSVDSSTGQQAKQLTSYVDEKDRHGRFIFWDRLVATPGFFTRKIRTYGDFSKRVDAYLLGMGPRATVDNVRRIRRQYETRLQDRFRKIVDGHLKEHPNL